MVETGVRSRALKVRVKYRALNYKDHYVNILAVK